MIRNIFSCIFGIIIGVIIFNIFDKNRAIYHGPNSKNIIKYIYTKNNKCYKLIPHITICPGYLSMNN